MKKKMLGLMLAVLVALPVFVNAEEGSVKIGEKLYPTLKEAVEAVESCEGICETATTITVLEDSETSGIVFASGKNLVIDFAGHTVSFTSPTVGSKGTETIDMQILKNSTIVFKNGTIISSDTETSKMLIQNYANLTLKDMTILATNELNQYAVSNNSGDVSIEGNTSIKTNAVAFDVCGFNPNNYPIAPKVTVNTTGTIEGTIEVTRTNGTYTRELSLIIKNVNHVGEIVIQEGLENNVTIENGTYTDWNVTDIITPAEGSEVYEIITQEGEYKVVVAEEDKLEEGYFGFAFENEALEEIYDEETLESIKQALGDKYAPAIYYEIVYGNLINNNFVLGTEISELEEAIEVTIDIPTTLEKVKEGYTRKYVVIRLHREEIQNEDGSYEYEYKTSVLDAKDNGDGTVSFDSDKFSIYVLAYEDVKEELPAKTGDINLLMLIGAIVVAITGIVVSTKKRLSNNI